MCQLFSFVTEPENNGGKRFYFNWEYRKEHLQDENDSHSLICKHFQLKEDVCNKYEFNPLTKVFVTDQINSPVDDSIQAESWVNKLDFKRVVEPLIIKPIVNPFDLPKVEHTSKMDIELLRKWDSMWASVWVSVGVSVGDSVGESVWDSMLASVRDSVWDSMWASVRVSVGVSVRVSVWYSVGAYISSFFDIKYKYDFSPCIQLWQSGLVPSFDGTTWRLHSGREAEVVYEISAEKLRKMEEK
jgi:hypothetical protein